jgi:hypothetical protein
MRFLFNIVLVAVFAIALSTTIIGCKKEEAPPTDIPAMEQPAAEAPAAEAPKEEAKK